MKILKRNDLYEHFEKKGGGSREKGRGRNEIHAPCACVHHNYANIFNEIRPQDQFVIYKKQYSV